MLQVRYHCGQHPAGYHKDRTLMRAHAKSGFDVLQQSPMVDPARIAMVSYCFGGTVAVELAGTGVSVVGTVAMHGSFRDHAPEATKNIKGRFLILHGAEDPVAPLGEVYKLIKDFRAAQVEWQYGSVQRRRARLLHAQEHGRAARQHALPGRHGATLQ